MAVFFPYKPFNTTYKYMLSRTLFTCILALSAIVSPNMVYADGTACAKSDLSQGETPGDSCFVHIDAKHYPVGEEALPCFAYEVQVGQPCGAGYDVEIRYPEYQKLSGQELKAVRQLQKTGKLAKDAEISKNGMELLPEKGRAGGLNLDGYLAISRKCGIFHVSFSPVVLHQGQWKRILSCQIIVKPREQPAPQRSKAAAAMSASERWAAKSVLAEGKWAKIRVSQEGIYQLTQSDVQKMGFSSLEKVKVYGYGGLLQDEILNFPSPNENTLQTTPPDDLVEVPTVSTADGRRLFWAEGTVRYKWNSNSQRYTHVQNTYSSYSYYFVTEGDAPAKVQQLAAVNAADAATTMSAVPYVTVYDKDTFSWYHGGRMMFDSHDFSTNGKFSYRLSSPELSASGNKTVEIQMGASSTSGETGFEVLLNGSKMGSLSVGTYDPDRSSARAALFTYNRVSLLQGDGSNTFQFTAKGNNSARLDFIRINYPRELSVTEQPYSFSPQKSGTVALQFSNANATTRVWRIGQVGSPTAELPATLGANGTLTAVTTTPARRFVCFDESRTYASPEYVGTVANQNLHGYANVDYVVVVPASGKLVSQAERLLSLHKERSGLTGCVVRADELYNEFSSGTPDASAYRRFLKMLYDRAGSDEGAMPKYCLFMGRGSWDNRLITEGGSKYSADDLLLVFEVDGSTTEVGTVYSYCTDDFFGFLDDGEGAVLGTGKLDIALGRMTCVTEEDARCLVDKVEAYMKNTTVGSWKNTVAILGDNGDSNGHMDDAERAAKVIDESAPAIDIQRVYWDRYSRTSSATGFTYPQATERIHHLMTEGAIVFDYSGHGSPSMISKSKVLRTKDFQQAYSDAMSLWILASCEIYPFDGEGESLAEASLYLPNGGSIAFICATRAVYAVNNVTLNRGLVSRLFTRGADGSYNSMGEALRMTKVNLVESETEKTFNKLKYILFGDPALPLALPSGQVVLDSINGKAIASGDALVKLSAGSLVTFSGHVCQGNGNDAVDKSFKGMVTATIYDSEETIKCKNNNGDDVKPYEFTERSKKIFQGSTMAEGGKFRFMLTIPRDISYTDNAGRINLYAVNSDHSKEYNGYSETFYLNGTSTADADTVAPKVVLYINDIDNPDYTVTDENPVLIADIYDENGINNAGIALGHDIELVLDDNHSDYINLKSYFNYDANSYQKGQIVYQLSGMSRGLHKASLRVWDVNNNYTVSDVHFIVRSDYHTGMNTDGYITSTQNPASTTTSLITYFPQNASEPGMVVYEVYDTRGRVVYKQSVNVDASARSSMLQWNLCGNDGQPLPDGLYFYRAVVNTADGRYETDAQKIIISR